MPFCAAVQSWGMQQGQLHAVSCVLQPTIAPLIAMPRPAALPPGHFLPADKQLTNTGLERGQALAADIEHMRQQWGLEVPVAAEDGVGHTYAK